MGDDPKEIPSPWTAVIFSEHLNFASTSSLLL
jgi:hypothetical protein